MKVYIGKRQNGYCVYDITNYGSIEGAKEELATNPMYIGTDHEIFIIDERTGRAKDLKTYEQEKALYEYSVYENACRTLGAKIFNAYHDGENVSKTLIDYVKELVARGDMKIIGQFIGKEISK